METGISFSLIQEAMMRTKLYCILCAILLAACGKHEPVPSAAPAANLSAAQAQPQAKAAVNQLASMAAFKIKGLFVGMDIRDVPNALMDILGDQHLTGFGFTDVIRYTDGSQCVLLYDKQFLRVIEERMRERYDTLRAQQKIDEGLQTSCAVSDGVLVVKSGEDGKVNRIEFNAVGDLFNFDDKGQPPIEFTKKLVNEYHIPSMKPNEEHNGWEYVTPDATRVEVVIKKIFGMPTVRLYMSKAGT